MGHQTNYISLEKAKNIIINALDQFNPELASRAASILYNEERLNVVEDAETNMMQCRPAGMTTEFLKSAGLHIPDFAEQYGPHFTQQDNPTGRYAIIDFEYHGSPQSIVWLAHELGHAIADDVQRENGHSFKDFSLDEAEEQAYFIQHIVSHHLKDSFPQHEVQDEDLEQDPLAMSRERAKQYIQAGRVFDEALANNVSDRKQMTIKALDQKLG